METALRNGVEERGGHDGTGVSRPALPAPVAPPGQQVHPVQRPRAGGKFIFVGDEKQLVRGVTYGAFRPDAEGNEYHDLLRIERDFAQMAANGANALRTYTVPPPWLLDAAHRHGLRVLVGLPIERYIGYLTDRRGAREGADRD